MNDCALTLHLFSTREDPTWKVGSKEATIIMSLWNSMGTHEPFEHLIQSVGYKGVEVNYKGNNWLVFRQYARLVRNGEPPQYRIDPEELLEKFLIGCTPPEIGQEVIEYMEVDWYLDYFSKLNVTSKR